MGRVKSPPAIATPPTISSSAPTPTCEANGTVPRQPAVPAKQLHRSGLEEEEAGDEPQEKEGVVAVTVLTEEFRAHTEMTFEGGPDRHVAIIFTGMLLG